MLRLYNGQQRDSSSGIAKETPGKSIRVLICQSPINTLFIQVAWANIRADEERINNMRRDGVILGESCLSCACRAALEILKKKFSGHDLEQARAVIIA